MNTVFVVVSYWRDYRGGTLTNVLKAFKSDIKAVEWANKVEEDKGYSCGIFEVPYDSKNHDNQLDKLRLDTEELDKQAAEVLYDNIEELYHE